MDNPKEYAQAQIINVAKTPEIAKKQQELNKQKAIKIINEANDFLLVGIVKNDTIMVSAINMDKVILIYDALKSWINFYNNAKNKIENPIDDFLGGENNGDKI